MSALREFDGIRFVAGSIVGLRSFQIDSLGRLTGVTRQTVFKPGENIAVCRRGASTGGLLSSSFMQTYINQLYEAYDPATGLVTVKKKSESEQPKAKPVSLKKKPQHRVAQLGCECGFWAYFDPNGSKWGSVFGIIEGYGTVTTGTRGFRAEKAKLLALVIKPKRENALTDRVRENYPDVPVFARKADALAKFPLPTHMIPTPDTDPEFWTRSAS